MWGGVIKLQYVHIMVTYLLQVLGKLFVGFLGLFQKFVFHLFSPATSFDFKMSEKT